MPDDNCTSLASRIDAIERNLQKLRRDTSRISAMTTRNREDLRHALADLDELLYAALATGRELTPGNPPPAAPSGAGSDPPRCTHPAHGTDPPETRPLATYLITLRSPHANHGQPHPPLPRCAECAAQVLKSPSTSRVAVRASTGTNGPRTTRAASPPSTSQTTGRRRPPSSSPPACVPASATATAAPRRPGPLERHRIPNESAPIAARTPIKPKRSARRR